MTMDIFQNFIKQVCGLVFENERKAVLEAGIRERTAATGAATSDAYYALLLRDRAEFAALVELLTVNETYFYREPAHLKIMTETVVPELLGKKKPGTPLRILSAGCSTGEEPYSLVMSLMEKYGEASREMFTVIGCDIDSEAIARAKAGVYGKGSFRDFPERLKAKYFEPWKGGQFRIRSAIAEGVRLVGANLLDDVYPAEMQRFDIIFYRNVSIYFARETQTEILRRLAGILEDDGCLFVSATETLFHDVGILALHEVEGCFLYRKGRIVSIGDRRTAPRNLPSKTPPSSVSAAVKRVSAERPVPKKPAESFVVVPKPAAPSAIPEDVKTSFDEALRLAIDKRYDEALKGVDGILGRAPSFIKAGMLKACILINLNRGEEAAALCRNVVEMDRWALEPHLLLGIAARAKNDDEEAAKRFREALYIRSSCWLAHFYLAEIHFSRNESEPAVREYEATVRLLEKGTFAEHGLTHFPLSFKAEHFITLCRHNLAKLSPKGQAR